MNASRLMCYFALLMVLIPWRAQAADADDFVAANRSQQAQLTLAEKKSASLNGIPLGRRARSAAFTAAAGAEK